MVGSLLVSLAGARLAGAGATAWWFAPRLGANGPLFYAGLTIIGVAWIGLGSALPSLSGLRIVAAVWSVPLVIGPALFSHDVYSYLAQGDILHLGLNPYHNPPAALAAHGQGDVLAAVSPFWRHTTAPYGPLFLKLVSLIVALTGAHLIAGVMLVRLLDVAGVMLVAVFVPRLARLVGADPRVATWLVVLSPLVLLQLIAAGHNDALMAGLMVAGVTLALERRPLVGIALCTIAATIKLPAAIAAVFITVAWARSGRDRIHRVLVRSVATATLTALAVTAVSGTGLSWVSSSLISTPQRVRLAITPATALGWTASHVLHPLGVEVSSRHLESALAAVALGLVAILAGVLLWRTRPETMVRDVGIVLLAAAVCGPATWPWYLSWGLVLVAAVPAWQRSRALAAVAIVSVFLVKPDGILALPLQSAPAMVAVYAVLVAGAARYALAKRREAPRPEVRQPLSTALLEPR